MLLSKVTYSNSYIHSYTDGCGCHAKAPTRSSGAVWGSVSFPRTLWHTDHRNWKPATFREQDSGSTLQSQLPSWRTELWKLPVNVYTALLFYKLIIPKALNRDLWDSQLWCSQSCQSEARASWYLAYFITVTLVYIIHVDQIWHKGLSWAGVFEMWFKCVILYYFLFCFNFWSCFTLSLRLGFFGGCWSVYWEICINSSSSRN